MLKYDKPLDTLAEPLPTNYEQQPIQHHKTNKIR